MLVPWRVVVDRGPGTLHSQKTEHDNYKEAMNPQKRNSSEPTLVVQVRAIIFQGG